MQSSTHEILPIIGTALGGGFYAGRILIDGQARALIVAPKFDGEKLFENWIKEPKALPGAKSHYDGMSNTLAMAEAGSEMAHWARGLRIAGHDDWYIPSVDEQEIAYRALKPTTDSNSGYARSGINLSAFVPTRPYTPELPAQTLAELFKEGAAEAFEPAWYWTSTQHAAYSGSAWDQGFTNGYQTSNGTSYEGRARAVRSLIIL